MANPFVIVGASLAGANAAATLRQEGFDGDVILVGAEARLPYERPPLSKQYLRGEVPFESLLVRPPAFYEDNVSFAMLLDRHTQRLQQGRDRIVATVTEGNGHGEVSASTKRQLTRQRHVAVEGTVKFPGHLEVLREVGPPIARADIPAGQPFERY
jgi:hypothetical protein